MTARDLVGADCGGNVTNPLAGLVNTLGDNAKVSEMHQHMEAPPPGIVHEEQELDSYLRDMSLAEHPGPAMPMGPQRTEEQALQAFLDGGDMFDPPDWVQQFWGGVNAEAAMEGQEYRFTDQNPFINHPNPQELAMAAFENGSLNEAILAFEAIVQANPNSSDAWRWLGTAHAENDADKLAIAALRRSLMADPENIEALLDAGVSYMNELVQEESLLHLQSWLRNHPHYAPIVARCPPMDELPFREKQQLVIGMFIEAATVTPHDPDVHQVLGVLWNLTREFDKAEEAFKTAVQLDPENHSLWNKLGATQANSPRANGSKDAVHAYRRAIDLKPNYVRAWVNMGISYANQGMFDVAAKYYLKALSFNSHPEHIWSYLRLAFTCMERPDLTALTMERNVDLFRSEIKF